MSRFLIKGEQASYEANTFIFQQGSPMNREEGCIYFMLDGRAHLVRKLPTGRILTNVVRRGDVFGVESSFCNDSETWEFSALVTQPSRVYVWNRNNYEIILGTYAEIAKATIVDQSRWLRKINHLIGDIDSGHPPTERLVKL